jgi:hypothetical protein
MKGPQVDRKADRMYMCVGLELINMGSAEPNIVSAAIRGRNSSVANLTFEFHSYSSFSTSYTFRSRVFNQQIPVYLAPHIFTIDAFQQHFSVAFSKDHEKNKLVSLFGGQLYLAFDWNPKQENIAVFETFRQGASKERGGKSSLKIIVTDEEEETPAVKVSGRPWSLVSPLKNNDQFLIVQQQTGLKPKLLMVTRNRISEDSVSEDWA